jgi:subtilase family serine protease
VIKIDGGSGSGRAQGEGDLDIQMELAMAPLANIKVFDGKGGDLVNVLTMEAGDASVDIISESYGWNVAASTATAAHNQHTAMTGTGKTYMAASGDSGTTLEPYSYPNYDPEVLQIGGTVATVDSVTGVRSSEVGWSGSGGGWSNNSASFNVRDGSSTSTATFQHSLTIVQGVATPNKRLVPDVALHSDGGGKGGYFFYYRGLLYTGSGTSFASPIFAGCLALSAQKLLATKSTFSGHFGRLQDWLYAHSGAAGLFFDVTIGNNGNLPSGQPSVAGSGWDFVTGLGAMNFNAFVTAY